MKHALSACAFLILAGALNACAPGRLDQSNFDKLFSAQSFSDNCAIQPPNKANYFGTANDLPRSLTIQGLRLSAPLLTQEINSQSMLAQITIFRTSQETDFAFRLEFRSPSGALDALIGLSEFEVSKATFESQIVGQGMSFEVASYFHLPGPLAGDLRRYMLRLKIDDGFLVGIGALVPVYQRVLERNFEVLRLQEVGQSFCLD